MTKKNKTIRYRNLTSDKEKQNNQIQKLTSDKEKQNNQINIMKDKVHKLNGTNQWLDMLINNLKVENKSFKQVYVERNSSFSSDYSKLTIIIPYRKTDYPEREENIDITLNYLSKIGIPNLIISEHSNISSKTFLINKYGNLFDSFEVIFNYTNENLFNKARAINKGVIESKTPYFAIIDIDALIQKKKI